MSNRNLILAAAGGAPSGPSDPNFNQTVLLLHGDGTNGAQNNTFLDSSSNTFTITRNGNTTQGTFSPFSSEAGKWSNYFNGDANSFVRFTDAGNVLDLDADFTIEFWVYQPAIATLNGTGNCFVSVDTLDRFQLLQNATTMRMWINGSVVLTSSTIAPLNTWAHYCVTRSGTDLTMYLNGSSVATGTSSYSMACSRLTIGGQDRGGSTVYNGCNSYISNFRIVKGTAITPPSGGPTSPLTAVSGTSLLTCQSNRYVDNSTNALAEIVGTTPSVQPFSPFAPSAAYSASVNGGSGYFDGTGDYLTVGSTTSVPTTGDFTVSFWMYNTSSATAKTVVSLNGNTGSYAAVRIDNSGTGGLILTMSTTGSSWQIITSTPPIGNSTLNRWSFISCVRDGGTIRFYQDGVQVYSTTTISAGTSLMTGTAGYSYVGAVYFGGVIQNYIGYVTDIRVEATALYPGGTTFTPPTAPADPTGSNLCLLMQNAGIFDNTGKNVLETVGNVQLDTATKVFGTASIEFDGTGDYLRINDNQNFAFGTGDFTIEFWVYCNTVPLEQWFVYWSGPSVNIIQMSSTGTVRWYANGGIRITGPSLSASTWYHIAVSRENGSTRLFVDGVQGGSTYADTNSYAPTLFTIGARFDGAGPTNGYIDDLRITKGVARYTTTFTPPTAALPDL